MTTIEVHAEHTYPVRIGSGLLQTDCHFDQYERILLIYPPSQRSRAAELTKLWEGRQRVAHFEHPDGEAGKEVTVLAQAWEAAAAAGIGRKDLVVALGGGATTDLGGFVAATWLRGVDVIHLATTLLGMVDAAVGGKTGINTETGKNLAGAFHSPQAVIADTSTLQTLPARDFNAGMAEVIKCGCISDPQILALVENGPRVQAGDERVQALIERAVAVKAQVVGSDLREAGLRETLNYGHTLAHAIEKLSNYRVRHGEAVAIGCIFAAHVAQELGYWGRVGTAPTGDLRPPGIAHHLELAKVDRGHVSDELGQEGTVGSNPYGTHPRRGTNPRGSGGRTSAAGSLGNPNSRPGKQRRRSRRNRAQRGATAN